MKGQDKGNGNTQPSDSNLNAQKKNHFYALLCRGDKEISPDVVTVMFQVFSVYVYALLDLGATLSFVTPLVSSVSLISCLMS